MDLLEEAGDVEARGQHLVLDLAEVGHDANVSRVDLGKEAVCRVENIHDERDDHDHQHHADDHTENSTVFTIAL